MSDHFGHPPWIPCGTDEQRTYGEVTYIACSRCPSEPPPQSSPLGADETVAVGEPLRLPYFAGVVVADDCTVCGGPLCACEE